VTSLALDYFEHLCTSKGFYVFGKSPHSPLLRNRQRLIALERDLLRA